MGKFLTGKARIEQTGKRRIWKLLENVLYQDDDGSIMICPRNMYSDAYTIPLWVDFIVGGGFDWDTRPSFCHDLGCYCRELPVLTIDINDLIDCDLLVFDEERNCYVCKDIPYTYLKKVKVSKLQVNNLLYRCTEAAGVPLLTRILVRIGVFFNIGWYIDILTKKVFELNLKEMYLADFWDKHVTGK